VQLASGESFTDSGIGLVRNLEQQPTNVQEWTREMYTPGYGYPGNIDPQLLPQPSLEHRAPATLDHNLPFLQSPSSGYDHQPTSSYPSSEGYGFVQSNWIRYEAAAPHTYSQFSMAPTSMTSTHLQVPDAGLGRPRAHSTGDLRLVTKDGESRVERDPRSCRPLNPSRTISNPIRQPAEAACTTGEPFSAHVRVQCDKCKETLRDERGLQ
jgi:hypothetical protein